MIWYDSFVMQVDVDQEVVLDCAESIMEALDNDGDGEITKVFCNIKIANIFEQ